MALKGDRIEPNGFTDIHAFMNETATAGGVVCVSTGASGAALDNAAQLVTYKASSSGGKPVGVLLQNMVNIDQTRQHLNWYQDEVQIGGKVCLLTKGQVLTSNIQGTPAYGDRAFLSSSGNVQPLSSLAAINFENTPEVGRFLSAKDADGYAILLVDL